MIVVMRRGCEANSIQHVEQRLADLGYTVKPIYGVEKTIVCAVGGEEHRNYDFLDQLRGHPDVEDVLLITKPYKLVSKEYTGGRKLVQVGDLTIGGETVVMMAGPCTVESEQQLFTAAEAVARAGAQVLRGGAYKPSTSPYSFQGMGENALRILRDAGLHYGMKVITEVMDLRLVDLVCRYTDILQIGARNMQNYDLLKEVGLADKPVMLKRGLSAKYEELLLAAEYIASSGNEQIMLCERGIRTFETYTRNTLDLSAVPVLQDLSSLPVVVDPSHGAGRRDLVPALSRAAVAAGADALIVEVHPNPDHAMKDGPQSLTTRQYAEMVRGLARVAEAVDRRIALPQPSTR